MLITFDRSEKRNAFDVPMFLELGRAYARLEREPEARVAVLAAAGDHFTGGLDLPQFAEPFTNGAMPLAEDGLDPLGLVGARVSKPIVCAVQGTCLTIGIELMLATEVRVASRDVRFGQIEIKRGIYPVGGATIRFIQELGYGNAMRWLLTGDTISAEEALRVGLVQEVVDRGKQLDRALEIAEVIAAQAPLGVRATIESARITQRQGEVEAARRLLPDLAPIMASADAREGMLSFVERREAKFTGR